MSNSDATRRFRRRVAYGHANARRRYLTPELREEAEALRAMIDKMYSAAASTKTRRRVKRIREGATAYQSRFKRWQHVADDDAE